jgi:hypothetical protein
MKVVCIASCLHCGRKLGSRTPPNEVPAIAHLEQHFGAWCRQIELEAASVLRCPVAAHNTSARFPHVKENFDLRFAWASADADLWKSPDEAAHTPARADPPAQPPAVAPGPPAAESPPAPVTKPALIGKEAVAELDAELAELVEQVEAQPAPSPAHANGKSNDEAAQTAAQRVQGEGVPARGAV